MNDPTVTISIIRSRGIYLATLDALDVERRQEWLPGGGLTHCNQAAQAALEALAAPLPHGLLANQQQLWLDSAASRLAGWQQCSAARAGERAEAGYPTVATLHEEGHGHIALVVPSVGGTGLHVWQAGRSNFSNGPIANGFGTSNLPLILYFTHD